MWAVMSLLIMAVAVVVLTVASGACPHRDEDGVSTLVWTYRDGRLRGWCTECQRLTRGWDVPAPTARTSTARVVSPRELAAVRQAQRQWKAVPRIRVYRSDVRTGAREIA